ncbi:sensor histidine kinase [Mucilaginibacter terrenus]|nr:histidine kinase [Mucilaginibacter terrenus]
MKNSVGSFALPDIKIPRVVQHVIFWLIVSLALTTVYSVQIDFVTSLRNNAFYMPVQFAYYYTLAYWLIPRFLFTGRYLLFALLLPVIVAIFVLLSRTVGVLFVIPYLIEHFHITDQDYLKHNQGPFLYKLLQSVYLVNTLKGTNLVIGFVLAIKLFKMWNERKRAALEAELTALKGQVHPHFLFNTLNNLYALSLNQSPRSPQLILGLSDILRYMLYECNTDEVPLEKEIFMMQQYVKLEKLRYEDRIDISFNISGDLQHKLVAPLMILPFIENAFKHGASKQTGDSWIHIDINVRDGFFKLKVANSNPGKDAGQNSSEAGHIGLKNVTKRLDLLYPGAYNLKIMDEEDTFLVVLALKLKVLAHPAVAVQQPVSQLATA